MIKKSILFVFLAILLLPVSAQIPASNEDPEAYEDIYVFMRIDRVGAYEIGAIFSYETERLYLPVADLFRVLQINFQNTHFYDTISGFFLEETRHYLIDHPGKKIVYDNKTIQLTDDDLLLTLNGLYMYVGLFGPVFGLHTTFNFRSMSVVLRTDLELPAIRDMRLAQMRQNLERLRGDVQVDTILKRKYHFLRMGMVDWGINATQTNGQIDDARVAMAVGGELLGGETNLFLNYSTRDGFDERRQQYQWRWVNNQTKVVKQLRAGKLSTSSIASVYAPMIGVSASNTPSTFRRSFGAYTLTEYTEPGWTVELYVNNVLVNYVVADASGFFSFDVPLIYGATQVMLKFYGPYGEERIREQYMNIPYNFIPKGEFEYNITGGVLQDINNTVFGRGIFNYGITRNFTIGGGFEYLSDTPSIGTASLPGDGTEAEAQPIEIPFLSASANLFNNLLLSAEYAYGVRSKAQLSYRLPSNMVLDLEYTLFEQDQRAIRFNYREERRATLALPLQVGAFRGQMRTGFRQHVYENFKYNTAELLFSTSIGKVSTSISGYATWIDSRTPYISSNLAMGIRLPAGFTLRPQAQFDVSNLRLSSIKVEVEKRIARTGHLSLGYEENTRVGIRSVSMGFRYDLPFIQTNLNTRVGNQSFTSSQGVRGSMAMGSGNNFLHTDNRSMVGRGGLTIIPFVDVNHNGTRDQGEPLATGLNVRLNGGRVLKSTKDSLIRIVELEPYTSYLMQLDESSLENIAWRLTHKTKSVFIDPNQFKMIEVPVLPMGEVSGTVNVVTEGRQRPIGRVLINFYHSDGRLFTQTMTEPDGYFIHMQFPPGAYYATPDFNQLERMGVTAEEDRIDFDILPDAWGDIVFGLEFVLHRKPSEDQATEPQPEPFDFAAFEQETRAAFEARLNAALRIFIEAQNAVLRGDNNHAMTLVDQSLSVFTTGQALALKGSLFYLAGDMVQARVFWLQAKELTPDLVFPDM